MSISGSPIQVPEVLEIRRDVLKNSTLKRQRSEEVQYHRVLSARVECQRSSRIRPEFMIASISWLSVRGAARKVVEFGSNAHSRRSTVSKVHRGGSNHAVNVALTQEP